MFSLSIQSVLLEVMFESPGSMIEMIQTAKEAILLHKPVHYIREKAKPQVGQSGSSMSFDQGSSGSASLDDNSP